MDGRTLQEAVKTMEAGRTLLLWFSNGDLAEAEFEGFTATEIAVLRCGGHQRLLFARINKWAYVGVLTAEQAPANV